MSFLILPNRRVFQPPGAAEIDWANLLTRGQVLDTRGDQYFRDAVAGRIPTQTVGALTRAVTQYGVAANFSSAVTSFGDLELFTGAQATWQIIEIPDNLTQTAGLVNKRTDSGTQNSYSIGYNYLSNEFTVEIGGGGAHHFVKTGLSTAGNNQIAVIDGQGGAGNIVKLYRNGMRVVLGPSSTESPFTNFANTTAPLSFGVVNEGSGFRYQGKILLIRAWNRALPVGEVQALSENPWQTYRPIQRPFFFDMGAGGGAGNATGTLAEITLTAATGSGSGAASASSALAAISLTAPQATASGGAAGLASGTLAAVTLSSPTASAQGSASASGALDGIDLSPPTANATAGATGFASGAVAPITQTAATGSASGSAIASAAYAGITLTAPNGTASAGQVGLASGALAPISINAPQGSATGAAAAFAAYTGITLTPPQGTADATSPVGNAAGSLRAITLTAITATANGGVVFARAPSGSGYRVKAQNISRPDRLQSSGRPATTNTRRP